MRAPALAVASMLLSGCFLFGNGTPKDPFAKTTMRVDTYVTDTTTSYPTQMSGNSADSWSNRPMTITFQSPPSNVTKFQLKRVFNGLETTCDEIDVDGNPMTNRNLMDWAGVTTEYTVTLGTEAATKTFDAFTVNVQPANIVVSGGGTLSDQNNDVITSAGPFFQTKSVDIGNGGYNGVNFDSVLTQYNPRHINFATLTVNNDVNAVSPDLIKTIYAAPLLKNDCGYLTTTFAAYTGPLDPKVAPLTLAEVRALPDPPSTATKLVLTAGMRFVYKTSEGLKGLINVDTISGTTAKSIGLSYSCEQ